MDEARDGGRGGGLDEHADLGCENRLGRQDPLVGDAVDPPVRIVAGRLGVLPRGRVSDADRRGDGLRLVDGLAEHERRGPPRLDAPHLGQLGGGRGQARRGLVEGGEGRAARVFAVPHPVGGDVARVADGQDVDVGGVAQLVDDLEGGRLLALEPVGVDRVDERHGVGLGQLPDDAQAVVEIAVHGDERRAVDDRLRQLPRRDLARGQDDGRLQPGGHGIGRRRGRRVARRGACHDLDAGLQDAGDGRGHPPVFEGARGVRPFDFDVDRRAGPRVERRGVHEGRPPFAEGDDRISLAEGEAIGVFGDQTAPLVRHQDSSTRLT